MNLSAVYLNQLPMSPFNLTAFTSMLQQARNAGYRFITFNPAAVDSFPDTGRCLLRHDVDGDLDAAVRMANAEAELGITATYFVMLCSPLYNLMSRAGQQLAAEILNLGHHIGLHYDQGFDTQTGRSNKETELAVQRQADWLELLLNCRVYAVSFHQPSATLLQAGVNCGTRINTYDRQRLKGFRYISDSNRVFTLLQEKDEDNVNAINSLATCWPEDIQLLIHPMWWVYDDSTTPAVWDRVLHSNFIQMQRQLLATERAYGPERFFVLTKRCN